MLDRIHVYQSMLGRMRTPIPPAWPHTNVYSRCHSRIYHIYPSLLLDRSHVSFCLQPTCAPAHIQQHGCNTGYRERYHHGAHTAAQPRGPEPRQRRGEAGRRGFILFRQRWGLSLFPSLVVMHTLKSVGVLFVFACVSCIDYGARRSSGHGCR